jgi:single-stranded DNA-specific DHH superfamily exonuclease
MIKLEEIKNYLDKSENPLIFFDDDSDGLASFLLIYKYLEKGKGIVVTHPCVDESYLKKVEEYNPDLVLILDKHKVEQEFVDKINVPIIWIDHHPIINIKGVKYFNPKFYNKKDYPTSYWCYKITKESLWIAMIGIISDWDLVLYNEFSKKYFDLIKREVKEPEDLYFETKFGILAKLFTFILKGKASEVKKSINILTRINDPYEILDRTTPRGKFIYQRFEKINNEYKRILDDALNNSIFTKNILLYTYYARNTSLTTILANELMYKFKDKLIIVAREKNDQIKISLRTYHKSKIILPSLVAKALEGLRGTGGGHEHACGTNINKEDFKEYIDRLEHLLKK